MKIHLKKYYTKPGVVIAFIIIIIVCAGTFFVIQQRKNAQDAMATPTPIPVPKKVSDLINTVSQQIQLPQGETPSVATVNDVTKLPKDPFFAKAQNGDKVLIYAIAGKAYLYRPSTQEVLQVSGVEVINHDATQSGKLATPSGEVTPVLKIKY